ncbi:hypothetical protein DL89DRAFT_15102 [Linderina pennispora]|uniref:Uncharacterized protein n=1 Tax=Linderina pennispora TaxID=61395 RepID=A0A1Y1WME0_9FUNG|nr:uncharacterized protein DL89DRAFT_15102 [Linderina pennispora]ORX74366.1 hypothetical protein DL89DRAFT_15102 [Linderina pennispora]
MSETAQEPLLMQLPALDQDHREGQETSLFRRIGGCFPVLQGIRWCAGEDFYAGECGACREKKECAGPAARYPERSCGSGEVQASGQPVHMHYLLQAGDNRLGVIIAALRPEMARKRKSVGAISIASYWALQVRYTDAACSFMSSRRYVKTLSKEPLGTSVLYAAICLWTLVNRRACYLGNRVAERKKTRCSFPSAKKPACIVFPQVMLKTGSAHPCRRPLLLVSLDSTTHALSNPLVVSLHYSVQAASSANLESTRQPLIASDLNTPPHRHLQLQS